MTSLQEVVPNSAATATGKLLPRDAAWRSAMARFEASLARIKPAMDALADAERAQFAARQALEDMAPPESLTVETHVEFYFNDGLGTPICRRYAQDVKLHDAETIARFTKGDTVAAAHFLNELTVWGEKRRKLETAHAAATTAAQLKYDASAATIARSDTQLLRVLRTPAPGVRELRWKIETLHKADCDERCETLGWIYVLQELAVLTNGAPGRHAAPN